MGSKDGVCDILMRALPNGENFYDLFGGGFSVTHAAILASKYKKYHFNEMAPGICDLIQRSINGEFNYKVFKPSWISREDFIAKKDTDSYIRICWSFGNDQKTYLFGKDIEAYKKSMHMAVVFDEFDETAKDFLGIDKWPNNLTHITNKRLYVRQAVRKRKGEIRQLQQLQQLEQLERLEQLQQLERLQRLQRLEFTSTDYRDVIIKPNSIIYCDPPYRNTNTYLTEFDFNSFDEWARKSEHPIFVSEYNMPPDFISIARLTKRKLMSSTKDYAAAIEQVFVNECAADMFLSNNNIKQMSKLEKLKLNLNNKTT